MPRSQGLQTSAFGSEGVSEDVMLKAICFPDFGEVSDDQGIATSARQPLASHLTAVMALLFHFGALVETLSLQSPVLPSEWTLTT